MVTEENNINSEEKVAAEEAIEVVEVVRRKIICVDDVQFMLDAIKEKLKKYYEVYPARSAEKLFETLLKVKADLILLDIGMPDTDGYEVIRRLKSDTRYTGIPVIFLTGKTDSYAVTQVLNLGAVDVLFKPVSDAKLLERIDYQFNPEMQFENRPIILAVDDSPSILKAVNHALNQRFKVYTLPKPESIKEVLKMVTPDLFLLDCNMPKMSGFDLIDIIRNTPMHEDTPIVFLTSESDNDTVYAAIGLGVCDYIVKPVDEKVLLKKMDVHLKDFIKRRLIRSVSI